MIRLDALREEEKNLLLLPEIKTGLLRWRNCSLSATATILFLLIQPMQLDSIKQTDGLHDAKYKRNSE